MVATLFMAAAGTAWADGSSLSRFGGEGWVYFNEGMPRVSTERSTFRQQDPKGLPEGYYQGLSSAALSGTNLRRSTSPR